MTKNIYFFCVWIEIVYVFRFWLYKKYFNKNITLICYSITDFFFFILFILLCCITHLIWLLWGHIIHAFFFSLKYFCFDNEWENLRKHMYVQSIHTFTVDTACCIYQIVVTINFTPNINLFIHFTVHQIDFYVHICDRLSLLN